MKRSKLSSTPGKCRSCWWWFYLPKSKFNDEQASIEMSFCGQPNNPRAEFIDDCTLWGDKLAAIPERK